ncbi:MAG: hypothetical protein GY856_21410 [bacterium]|nr:hypothetical protein [bacterium]
MNRKSRIFTPHLYPGSLPAAAILALSLMVVPPVSAGQRYEGQVDAVRIAVWSLPGRSELTTLAPGDTLSLEPGQRVMLRVIAPAAKNPTGQRQYLSAEFGVERGVQHVELSEGDRDRGSVVVEALRRGTGKTATLRYTLLGNVEVARRYQASATIEVESAAVESIVATPPEPPPMFEPRGVTLYDDSNFRGRSLTLDDDVADLGPTALGNDRVSSVKVPPGCTVTLYGDAHYRGRSATLDQDSADLGRTSVGNDAVSSVRVACDY